MWLTFLVLHLIGNTGYNLLLRKSLLSNTDRWTLAVVMQTGISLPILVALFVAPPPLSIYTPANIFLVVITAILVVALHVTNIHALQNLEASTFSVLYNLRILLTTLLGIAFLQEEANLYRIIGGAFIFLAVLSIRQKGSRQTTAKGVAWGIAAALVISVLNWTEKVTINALGYLGYAIPVMLLAAVIVWTVSFIQKKRIGINLFLKPQVYQLMTLRSLSAYGFSLALFAGGTLSVSSYISSLGVVLTVICGTLLLNERDHIKEKVIATALAVIGLTLILFSRL